MNESRQGKLGEIPVLFLLKSLLFSYILTGGLLLLLALLLYKVGLSQRIVSICIIAIYVLATFFAGALMGVMYFLVLAVISLIVNRQPGILTNSFLTTLVLCGGGGMLGGMIS